MTPFVQSNGWSCLLTSFAMVLDVEPRALTQLLCHDGSEIIWPNQPEPLCRRSFHIQEMYEVCATFQYSVVPWSFAPALTIEGEEPYILPNREDLNTLIIGSYDMVVEGVACDTGRRHACAWDHRTLKLHDPRGSAHEDITEVFSQVTIGYLIKD